MRAQTRMLAKLVMSKAQSLPQITLTDFDQETNQQVLFGEKLKAAKKKSAKIKIVIPDTSSSEHNTTKKQLSEDSADSSDNETEGTRKKANKTYQKGTTKSAVVSKKKKVLRQNSVTLGKSVKPKVSANRRGSLDFVTKVVAGDRRGSLESSKTSALGNFGKKLIQKAKPVKEKSHKKRKSSFRKNSSSSTDEEEGDVSASVQKPPVKVSETPPKTIPFSFSLQNLKAQMAKEDANEASGISEDQSPSVNETQGKAIAKHFMNSTKAGLTKFKLAAKQKGVAKVDPYDAMCEQAKTMGATGRRIFDRKEIFGEEDTQENISEKIQNARSKYMDALEVKQEIPKESLKDPTKSFGLWDHCDPKHVAKVKGENKILAKAEDIIAELPDWERTKEKRDQMEAFKQEYQNLVVDENSASKSKLTTGKYLSKGDFDFCAAHTKFDEKDILRWFKGFRKDCPSGHLSKVHLSKLFMKVFPEGNGGVFSNNIFRVFDKDKNGYMEFHEFLMALDVTTCKTGEDKLIWAFRLYDVDGNGSIDLEEMTAIIEILDDLEGREAGAEYFVDNHWEILSPAEERAKIMFEAIDINGDGGVSLEEFIKVGKKLFNYEDDVEEEK